MQKRQCGECQLCCQLVPVEEILKKAGVCCEHQKEGVGCAVYKDRPLSCRAYFCGWLAMDAARGLGRPDQSHYIIHPFPDTVRMSTDGQESGEIKVMVVWCDPKFPDAHRDPKLRYLINKHKIVMKVAFDSVKSLLVIPASMTGKGTWHEQEIVVDWSTPMAKWAVKNGMV
jgi:hypothetical protein